MTIMSSTHKQLFTQDAVPAVKSFTAVKVPLQQHLNTLGADVGVSLLDWG